MTVSRASLVLFSTMLVAACSDPRGRALKTMEKYQPDRLRKEVALYYKDVFAEHRKTSDNVTIGPKYWSEAFRAFSPERITAYPDGFAFCLEIRGDAESGIYVVPLGMELEPQPTSWASYEKLFEGVFWYSFKP